MDDGKSTTRTVPMRLLCLGLGRTGTASLGKALETLNYKKIYALETLMVSPRDVELWERAMDAKFYGKGVFGREEWDLLFGGCEVVKSLPASLFAAEIIAAYPEARVILTTRDANSWYESYRQTVWRRFVQDPVLRIFSYIDPLSYYGHILHRLLPLYFKTEAGTLEATHGKNIFMQHNGHIRDLVPKDRLLEWRVGESDWDKLCEFLDKNVPSEKFPVSNERGAFWPDCRRRDWSRVWSMGAKALVWMMPVGVGVFALKTLYPPAV
ncbi:MAG: hypothetical protein M1840_004821 [Geoglossum simile]|nr:MAG: hypothetical protein M1840_004821 [Geoglossum simile]